MFLFHWQFRTANDGHGIVMSAMLTGDVKSLHMAISMESLFIGIIIRKHDITEK